MLMKTKKKTKTPLSKAQGRLLNDSLQKLLGTALIDEKVEASKEIRPFVLKEALNSKMLDKPLR